MNVEFSLSGTWDGLYEAMKALPEKTKDSALRSYNRKLMKKYIVGTMRSSLPYSPRQKQYIILTSVKGDKTAVSGGFSTKAKWVAYQEFGTDDRYTMTGAYRGKIVPQNRVDPLIDSQIPNIVKEWDQEVGTEVLKTIDRKIKANERKLKKLS